MAHLALKTELDARQRDYLEKIRFAGEHLLAIIDDILDFSRIEAGKLELGQVAFSLAEVLGMLSTVVGPKAASKELALVFELAADLPPAQRLDEIQAAHARHPDVNQQAAFLFAVVALQERLSRVERLARNLERAQQSRQARPHWLFIVDHKNWRGDRRHTTVS